MKKKARISRQLLILFFEIQSCSTLKNIIYDRQIREAEHELEKLKELIVKSILIDHLNPILIDHPKLV